jgi:hypothetical protein
MTTAPRFMRRKDAGAYLKTKYGFGAFGTLSKYAVIGGGPAYVLNGRTPLYEVSELDRWAESKLSGPKASTSDYLDPQTRAERTPANRKATRANSAEASTANAA